MRKIAFTKLEIISPIFSQTNGCRDRRSVHHTRGIANNGTMLETALHNANVTTMVFENVFAVLRKHRRVALRSRCVCEIRISRQFNVGISVLSMCGFVQLCAAGFVFAIIETKIIVDFYKWKWMSLRCIRMLFARNVISRFVNITLCDVLFVHHQ